MARGTRLTTSRSSSHFNHYSWVIHSEVRYSFESLPSVGSGVLTVESQHHSDKLLNLLNYGATTATWTPKRVRRGACHYIEDAIT